MTELAQLMHTFFSRIERLEYLSSRFDVFAESRLLYDYLKQNRQGNWRLHENESDHSVLYRRYQGWLLTLPNFIEGFSFPRDDPIHDLFLIAIREKQPQNEVKINKDKHFFQLRKRLLHF